MRTIEPPNSVSDDEEKMIGSLPTQSIYIFDINLFNKK